MLLPAVAVLLWAALAESPALGQAGSDAATIAEAPDHHLGLPLPGAPAAQVPSGAVSCPLLDFWIVSSRCCPQSGCARCALCCPFDYFQVNACGQLLPGDAAGFSRWLQPGVPVLIVVHGSLVSWDSLIRDSGPLYRWIRNAAPDRPLQVVFFSWPSNTPIICPAIDFIRLGQRAQYNGFYLSRLVTQIPPESPISFFGHSHGASVTASALHLFAGGQVDGQRLWFGDAPNRPLRAVFAAAAIEQDWLNPGQTFDRALWKADALLNVYNSTDIALCFYPWRYPFSDPALGSASFGRNDLQALGPLVRKVADMDVSQLLIYGHTWENYYEWPQIAAAMVPWVYLVGADPRVPDAPPLEAPPTLRR